MSKKKPPTEAELRILRILWEGPVRLNSLCEALARDAAAPLAKTTVATMLKIMRDKGLVERIEKDGRPHWRSKVKQSSAEQQSVWELIDRVFQGSAHQLVSHLLNDKKLKQSDREKIAELIRSEGRD